MVSVIFLVGHVHNHDEDEMNNKFEQSPDFENEDENQLLEQRNGKTFWYFSSSLCF